MAVANSDGVSIYYERHGQGPAVLFVHGSGGHHAAWWQQVAALRDRYTVLTVDLRGFGKSDSSMPEFDGQDFPGDIVAVLDREDLTDVVLVGHREDVAREVLAVELRHRRVGLAEAAQVDGDHGEARPQIRDLLPPGGVVAAGAVHEQDSRAAAVPLVIDGGALGSREAHQADRFPW